MQLAFDSIRTAVAAHVTTAFTNAGDTVTLKADPQAFESLPKNQFPVAIILFGEEEPERLDYKQQRRRVSGTITLAKQDTTREIMDLRIEAIRDLIFADETLGASVDDITAEAGLTVSNPDENTVYGTLDITTEEVF